MVVGGGGGSGGRRRCGDILRYESWDVSFVSRLLYNSSLCWRADQGMGTLWLQALSLLTALRHALIRYSYYVYVSLCGPFYSVVVVVV